MFTYYSTAGWAFILIGYVNLCLKERDTNKDEGGESSAALRKSENKCLLLCMKLKLSLAQSKYL